MALEGGHAGSEWTSAMEEQASFAFGDTPHGHPHVPNVTASQEAVQQDPKCPPHDISGDMVAVDQEVRSTASASIGGFPSEPSVHHRSQQQEHPSANRNPTEQPETRTPKASSRQNSTDTITSQEADQPVEPISNSPTSQQTLDDETEEVTPPHGTSSPTRSFRGIQHCVSTSNQQPAEPPIAQANPASQQILIELEGTTINDDAKDPLAFTEPKMAAASNRRTQRASSKSACGTLEVVIESPHDMSFVASKSPQRIMKNVKSSTNVKNTQATIDSLAEVEAGKRYNLNACLCIWCGCMIGCFILLGVLLLLRSNSV